MLHPKMNEIIAQQKNRYSVVIATAKRARYIAEEALESGEILPEKPISMAIKEFENGKLCIITGPEAIAKREKYEEAKRLKAEAIAKREAELAAVKFTDDDDEMLSEDNDISSDIVEDSLDEIFIEETFNDIVEDDE